MIIDKLPLKTTLILLFICNIVQAQLWSTYAEKDAVNTSLETKKSIPKKHNTHALDLIGLEKILLNVPKRNTQENSDIIIELPHENGKLVRFKIFEAQAMSEVLMNKFPNIKSYIGIGVDNPSMRARFNYSKNGFNAVISSPNYNSYYIEPYISSNENYISYSKADISESIEQFTCMVEESPLASKSIETTNYAERNFNDATLRTYRIALVCTAEYSQFHLNLQGIDDNASEVEKKEAVLGELNTVINRVNAIFERDLAITFELVDNNDDIIFLDPDTDNLTNSNTNLLIDEGNDIMFQVIGNENFDIGHTLCTNSDSLAFLNSACTNSKGGGVTGLVAPIGDVFYIDFLCHEIGHQFGATHTQNFHECNAREITAIEPGSGTTIMGYAGTCFPNVQNNSDHYFNVMSIAQMWINITFGNSTCATETATNNDAPTVDAGEDFTIPASTPFILMGSGSDPNSEDMLTYCWEQIDAEIMDNTPIATNLTGALFRSLPPTESPNRYMPAIETVISGNTATEWEVIPSVSRTMDFRVIVRDNAIIGSTESDIVTITVTDDAGPFVVSTPNTYVNWEGNTTETVTWNVAGTNENGINANLVDILLSVDGGYTYTTTIAEGVANDGSHDILVPNEPGTENRIMIKGTNHIFYDISNENFEITEGDEILSNENFETINDKKLSVFPNPVSNDGILNISSNFSYSEYTIYDMSGKAIQKGQLTNDFLNLDKLQTGIYFLNLNSNTKGKALVKFIVQ